jgi:hypothetical protein
VRGRWIPVLVPQSRALATHPPEFRRGKSRTDILTRYFSPTEHNRPTSLDELFRLNDVEFFDLEKARTSSTTSLWTGGRTRRCWSR